MASMGSDSETFNEPGCQMPAMHFQENIEEEHEEMSKRERERWRKGGLLLRKLGRLEHILYQQASCCRHANALTDWKKSSSTTKQTWGLLVKQTFVPVCGLNHF